MKRKKLRKMEMKEKRKGNAIFIRLGKRNKDGEVSVLRNVTIRNLYAEIAFERPDYAYDIRGPALPLLPPHTGPDRKI